MIAPIIAVEPIGIVRGGRRSIVDRWGAIEAEIARDPDSHRASPHHEVHLPAEQYGKEEGKQKRDHCENDRSGNRGKRQLDEEQDEAREGNTDIDDHNRLGGRIHGEKVSVAVRAMLCHIAPFPQILKTA
jgi:hypothetical protein